MSPARILALVVLAASGCYDFSRYDALPDLGTPFLGGLSKCRVPPAIPGLIDCTGFESGAGAFLLGAKDGAATIDPGQFARGQLAALMSVRPNVDGTPANAEASLEHLTFGKFVALRAFVFFPEKPPTNTRLLSIQHQSAPFNGVQFDMLSDARARLTHFPATAESIRLTSGAFAVPIARWACLELQLTIGDPGLVSLFIDGEIVSDAIDRSSTLDVRPFDLAMGGLYLSNGTPQPFSMWIDELVVASEPIGCER